MFFKLEIDRLMRTTSQAHVTPAREMVIKELELHNNFLLVELIAAPQAQWPVLRGVAYSSPQASLEGSASPRARS